MLENYQQLDYSFTEEMIDAENIAHKYRTFAQLINVYGIFVKYIEFKKLKELLTENNSWVLRLFEIIGNDLTDPLLLTAICKLAYKCFDSEIGLNNRTAAKKMFLALKDFAPLLEYLEGDRGNQAGYIKYTYICNEAMKYEQGSWFENKPIQFENLTNPVVHNLMISIIELIKFVCKYSVDPKGTADTTYASNIGEQCFRVSQFLNTNNRETILFNCLNIPSDDVKIAIAKCLSYVKIDEIEADELTYMIRLISEYKNLGAGRTEEVKKKMRVFFLGERIE